MTTLLQVIFPEKKNQQKNVDTEQLTFTHSNSDESLSCATLYSIRKVQFCQNVLSCVQSEIPQPGFHSSFMFQRSILL